MILFNEYRYYKTLEIVAIFSSALLCLLGVKALTAKHQNVPSKEEAEPTEPAPEAPKQE